MITDNSITYNDLQGLSYNELIWHKCRSLGGKGWGRHREWEYENRTGEVYCQLCGTRSVPNILSRKVIRRYTICYANYLENTMLRRIKYELGNAYFTQLRPGGRETILSRMLYFSVLY